MTETQLTRKQRKEVNRILDEENKSYENQDKWKPIN